MWWCLEPACTSATHNQPAPLRHTASLLLDLTTTHTLRVVNLYLRTLLILYFDFTSTLPLLDFYFTTHTGG